MRLMHLTATHATAFILHVFLILKMQRAKTPLYPNNKNKFEISKFID